MSNIFEPRHNILPYEYPEFLQFTEAIHNSFWEVSHFNFERDCRDFKIELSEVEKQVIMRAMLSISVVENKVKSFWANCPQRFPKPEIANAGFTFAANEVVHQLCYQKVLDLLGLSEQFIEVLEIPCMKSRAKYLTKYLEGVNSRSNKEYTKSLILFTLMVENCSLFSQFLIP